MTPSCLSRLEEGATHRPGKFGLRSWLNVPASFLSSPRPWLQETPHVPGQQGRGGTHPRQKARSPLRSPCPLPAGSVCRSLEDSCLGLTSHPFLMPLNLK